MKWRIEWGFLTIAHARGPVMHVAETMSLGTFPWWSLLSDQWLIATRIA